MEKYLCHDGKEKAKKGEKAMYDAKEKVLHHPSTAKNPTDVLKNITGKGNTPTLKTESEPVLKKFLGK